MGLAAERLGGSRAESFGLGKAERGEGQAEEGDDGNGLHDEGDMEMRGFVGEIGRRGKR